MGSSQSGVQGIVYEPDTLRHEASLVSEQLRSVILGSYANNSQSTTAEQCQVATGSVWDDPRIVTYTTTASVVMRIGPEGWEELKRFFQARRMSPSTKAMTSTAVTVSSIRSLLQMRKRDDMLKRMTPEKRALYERIVKLREKIGPVNMNLVEAIRELREDG